MKLNIKNLDLSLSNKFVDLFLTLDVRTDIIAQVVRWQLAKARSGNADTKTRSDVHGTTRKPHRQKGTGRARQGSLKGPHFRGGGVVFGPHPRSYEFSLNKKVKRIGMLSIISDKIINNALHLLESYTFDFSKTKDFVHWKEKNNIKSMLFVGDLEPQLARCLTNIPYCNIIKPEGLNVLSCVKHENVFFDVSSLEKFLYRYPDIIGNKNLEVLTNDKKIDDQKTEISEEIIQETMKDFGKDIQGDNVNG